MSVVTEVRCDAVWGNEHTACAARFHRTGNTAEDLKYAARAAGWRVDPDGDLCPTHARVSR